MEESQRDREIKAAGRRAFIRMEAMMADDPCPDCKGNGSVQERQHGPNGIMHSWFNCDGCGGSGVMPDTGNNDG